MTSGDLRSLAYCRQHYKSAPQAFMADCGVCADRLTTVEAAFHLRDPEVERLTAENRELNVSTRAYTDLETENLKLEAEVERLRAQKVACPNCGCDYQTAQTSTHVKTSRTLTQRTSYWP